MRDFIKTFFADESGAVTVDWVVLTAAVVGLGFSVIVLMSNGTSTIADNAANVLSNSSPSTGF